MLPETPTAAPAAESPFVLRMPASFWWTVRVPIPTDNGYQIGTLELLFKPVSQTRLDQYRGIGLEPGQPIPTEHEICHEVVAGWRNVADEEGVVQRFSREALNHVLDVPVARGATVATYMAVMSGMAARKNA
jgi:hypothetical protein